MRRIATVPPLAACALVLIVVVGACGGTSNDDKAAADGGGEQAKASISVAYDAALSGFLAPFDGLATKGSKLAVEEINAAGGIGGKTKIDLEIHDMKSDAATAVTVAQQIIDGGADVILPGCNTDFQVAVASVAEKNNLLMFSPCNADPTIAQRFKVYFPTGMAGNYQAAAVADYAKSQGYEHVYVFDAPDFLYVNTITKYFTAAAPSRGLTIMAKDVFKVGQTDFSSQVTKIRNASPEPDVIVTGMFTPDIATFVKQLRAAGIKTPVLGTDGVDSGVTPKDWGQRHRGTDVHHVRVADAGGAKPRSSSRTTSRRTGRPPTARTRSWGTT